MRPTVSVSDSDVGRALLCSTEISSDKINDQIPDESRTALSIRVLNRAQSHQLFDIKVNELIMDRNNTYIVKEKAVFLIPFSNLKCASCYQFLLRC